MPNGDHDAGLSVDDAPSGFHSLERRLGRRSTRTTRSREDANAIRALGETWFRVYRPTLVAVLGELGLIENFDRQLRDLLGRVGTQMVIADVRTQLRALARFLERQILPAYEAARWSEAAQAQQAVEHVEQPSGARATIAERLELISPDLAASYRQVHADLAQPLRSTYLGPAGEIREVMRAAIHLLAPDEDVAAQEWYEGHNGRPTQTERVRFILEQRNQSEQSPGEAAEIVEQKVAQLGRRLYGRASAAFHAGTQRDEVDRIIVWVEAVLNEILPTPSS